MVINQVILYSQDREDVSDRLRRHEEKHREQFARDGVVGFVIRYFSEYVWYRGFRRMSHHNAYVNISYEKEAIAAEEGDDEPL